MERSDHDILGPEEMGKIYTVSKRVIVKMAREGRAPMPIGGLKPPYRWRWGAVRKWHEAMETLHGVGFSGVNIEPDLTESDDLEPNVNGNENAPSGKAKPK